MVEVFFAILPVFLVILVGMVADRLEMFPARTGTLLSQFVLRLALPILLFWVVAIADPGDLLRGGFWFGLIASQLAIYALGYGVERLAGRAPQPSVTTAMSCSCGIVAFIGIPIIQFLYPGNSEALLVVGFVAIMPSLSMALWQAQYALLDAVGQGGSGNARQLLWVLVRSLALNPMVIGVVCGALVSASGLTLWRPLDRAAALIGSVSGPCILLALGLDMRGKFRIGMRARGRSMAVRQTGIGVAKLLLHPLLAWGLMAACGVEGLWLSVAVIATATGTAVGPYIVAEIFGGGSEESALSVVLNNGVSLFTLSCFAYLLQ